MLNRYLQSNIQTKGDVRFIHCPEIVSIYCGGDFEDNLYNQQYEYKKRRRAELLAANDFEGYVFLTERPYRLNALLDIIGDNKCNAERLANLIMQVWADSESPSTNIKIWRKIFSDMKNCRVFQESKNSLPERFKVWRGGTAKGISWTTDEKVAHWFAKRLNKNDAVHCREITRDNAVCYVGDRGEKEIILL
jgi:hypothetical protein